ncbi:MULTISPECIES: hypothetical protein [unclassified Moorena]|uniref:hypothetical protein n=1 Tax=unclassified Moorena TaxID=2683338 RepID=UPI0014004FED|nr:MULTISPECIES: hypothetical protein [unclassified Moorena]NEO15233.1 hypothetical protein [Moorena sp. SIO3E8]NEP98649.1 hypothetical protein [Moorena sp. SIO3F7]
MRYRLFLPLPYYIFAISCSLLPAPCSLKPRDLYLMGIRLAIFISTLSNKKKEQGAGRKSSVSHLSSKLLYLFERYQIKKRE